MKKKLATGDEITPPLALKDFGFVGGANVCREGIIRGQGSCVVIIGYQGGVPLTDVRYSSADCPLPERPINFAVTAGAAGTKQVTLSWNDNSIVEDQFKVYRGKNTYTTGCTSCSWSLAPTATITTTSIETRGTAYTYTWTNLSATTNSGKYCFKVTARLRDGGESDPADPSPGICVTCDAAGTCNRIN